MTSTLLEAIQASLAGASSFNASDAVPPAVVLWADPAGQWQPIVALLHQFMPQLLSLGDYAPEKKQGPAIWLRTLIEQEVRQRDFPELDWEAGDVPIIYMAGVSRQQLRAGEDCPSELQPLVELQYRGTVWKQRNGRDWTVEAFLVSSSGGLELDVAGDSTTRRAMLGALGNLASISVESLRGRRLEADDFNLLMVGDPVRELLIWMGSPESTRDGWGREKWGAFRAQCQESYGFDPEAVGELEAAGKLGNPEGPWLEVWRRFSEGPASYPGIPDLLRRAKPSDLFLLPEYWPGSAEDEEESLRVALEALADSPLQEASERVLELEISHGPRREWVWAKLGMCRLAFALEPLSRLATTARTAAGGSSTSEMAAQYRTVGFRADAAVLDAVAAVSSELNRRVVSGVAQAIYRPWLDDSARRFQKLLQKEGSASLGGNDPVGLQAGDCLLFVDGLRFDLGEKLCGLAEELGVEVTRSWRWAALPTVTATGKPAVTPLSHDVSPQSTLLKDFTPQYGSEKAPLGSRQIDSLLRERGIERVDGLLASGALLDGPGWAESAQIDKLGHDLGLDMVGQLKRQLELILESISGLFTAGWKRVRVVTDHGWLLMPGGLEKVPLPKYLTESRWARCATINDTSHVDVPVFGWSWNPSERFATAPGACAFRAGVCYAHGGVSLQECVIPDLTFTPGEQTRQVRVEIASISWAGLRCRATVDTEDTSALSVQVRRKPNDPGSAVSPAKPLDEEGEVSLLVENEELLESAACVVVIDGEGHVIVQSPTVIGGEG